LLEEFEEEEEEEEEEAQGSDGDGDGDEAAMDCLLAAADRRSAAALDSARTSARSVDDALCCGSELARVRVRVSSCARSGSGASAGGGADPWEAPSP
jgi:hypothetical protein